MSDYKQGLTGECFTFYMFLAFFRRVCIYQWLFKNLNSQ